MDTPLPLMTEVSSSSQPLGTAVLGRVFVVAVVDVAASAKVAAEDDCAEVAADASPSLARDSKGPDEVGAGIQLQKSKDVLPPLFLSLFGHFSTYSQVVLPRISASRSSS